MYRRFWFNLHSNWHMKQCTFELVADRTVRCTQCGFVGKKCRETDMRRVHRNCTALGWGDRLERILRRFGITEYRYTRTMIYLHLKPKGWRCKCPKNRERINRLGDDLLRWWRSLRW